MNATSVQVPGDRRCFVQAPVPRLAWDDPVRVGDMIDLGVHGTLWGDTGDMRERGPVRAGAARRDGVIGVVVGVAGLWVLGVILGIVALVFGLKARRAGGGLTATAAVALGIIDIVVWVLAGGGWDSSPGYATLQPAPW